MNEDKFGDDREGFEIKGIVHTPPVPGFRGGPHDLRTTGHDDCMRPLTMDRFPRMQMPAKEYLFSHIDPLANPDEVKRQIEYVKQKGILLTDEAISGPLAKERMAFHKKKCIAPEIARVAERLFTGGNYVFQSVMAPFAAYRIAEIPDLPEVELATLIVPTRPDFILSREFDVSLDILLAPIDETLPMRTSLRIPVMTHDHRVPKKMRDKKFHILVASYTGSSQNVRHYHAYSDRWALEQGIVNAIKKYDEAVLNHP